MLQLGKTGRPRSLDRLLGRMAGSPRSAEEQADLARCQSLRADLESADEPVGDIFERAGGGLSATVADEAKSASVTETKALILYRLVRRTRPSSVVEFGSCFGVSAAHMAAALERVGAGGRLTTVEGSPSRQAIAQRTLERVGTGLATSVLGYVDDELARLDGAELVFIDGNHQVEPTLRYVDEVLARGAPTCTIVLDDIADWADDFSEMWADLTVDGRFSAAGAAAGLGVLTVGSPAGLRPSLRDRLASNRQPRRAPTA